jgi:hypothetical protein
MQGLIFARIVVGGDALAYLAMHESEIGTSQPWQLPRRTAGYGSKAGSDVPRITRELRLLTFEYPGERLALLLRGG